VTNQQVLDTGIRPYFSPSNPDDLEEFIRMIRGYYNQNRRSMPWRDVITPYRVVVSELMLQQTQVPRVMEKFPLFIRQFPEFSSLACAPPGDVIEAWQGLGYNRRSRYLHALAIRVMENYHGNLPDDPDILVTFPGIGKATAGSISAFAFNKPVIFIETNIRRVYIHHFFPESDSVADNQIVPLVEMTLDQSNPREWYYALMDYGSWLAKRMPNPNRRSRHYTKQSAFEGSDRQIRGRIIGRLIKEKTCTIDQLVDEADEKPRGMRIVSMMIEEGFICEADGFVRFSELAI